MGDIIGESRRWRMKAEELRAIADCVSNEIARDTLLQMAEGYDRLAQQMEEIAEVKARGA
jgi:hypothetical protein